MLGEEWKTTDFGFSKVSVGQKFWFCLRGRFYPFHKRSAGKSAVKFLIAESHRAVRILPENGIAFKGGVAAPCATIPPFFVCELLFPNIDNALR